MNNPREIDRNDTPSQAVGDYQLIVNPKSGSHLNISGIRALRDRLRQLGHRVELTLTESLEHAGILAGEAVARGVSGVIVAGGDGTVRDVVDAMAGSTIPILIVPSGTENLLATDIGLDGGLERSLSALAGGQVRNLDLGNANGRHFMAIAGIGFDGEIIRRTHAVRSGHVSPMDYVWPICQTFWGYQFPSIRVEADGDVLCDEPALVFVCNIARYAVGLRLSPDADCGDGELDVCIYRCRNRLQLLRHSVHTVLKRSGRGSDVIRKRCKRLNISSETGGVPVQLDGDPGPELPLTIEVIPRAARLLTPPPPPGKEFCPPVRFYYLKRWVLGRGQG
ncbi:MAG: diacylglycerol kinase family lipid kinase [Phycisphaerae bacterium]|nr:diacylglycerol kinase family lipid kinase [Phycisphaerae bacterium]